MKAGRVELVKLKMTFDSGSLLVPRIDVPHGKHTDRLLERDLFTLKGYWRDGP